ncbi:MULTISPECIES: hypothetical protein [unclassified Streptomyces]|uniref:hypothetical protein n=1 Tax=unclassified Streptomyces TaxID=2593676 RepID=UPI00203615D8|nr:MULTISPECIES: hypothetical protein [unclassified Streptomyces]
MTNQNTGTPVSTPATAPVSTAAPVSTSPKFEVDKAMLDGPTPKDLLPATGNYPVEIVRYRSVVLTDIPGAKPARKLTGAIDLGEENLPFYDRPAEGMIVTTEQSWSAQGVTLGRLLHSLALAPGESTKVAVVDWQRTTKATGTETASEAEALSGTTDQNRSISEVANAIAREEQFGTSQATQVSKSSSSGGSAGVAFFGMGAGGNWGESSNSGFTTAVSRSTGVKSVAQEATQRISARTQQLATAARSRNMTVVRETTQAEKDQVLTRVVTNYNHMHAMSVQYYEVVQVYNVTTKPTRLERCLFIPLQELTFNYTSLQRYKEVLASVAPADWAAKIRAANPFDTTVRKLDACTAPEAPSTAQIFDGVDLADIAASAMGVYGVRKYDGSPVKFDPVGRQWNPLPTTGLDGDLTRIAPGKDTVWGLRTDNMLMQFDGTTWRSHPHSWRALALACGPDGTLYLVGGDNTLGQRALNGTIQGLNVKADDVAAVGRDKVWYCREGRTWERSGTDWTERTPAPNVKRLSAGPDGVLWGITADGKALVVEAGATTWTAPKYFSGIPGIADVVSSVGGDYWALVNTGLVLRLLTAARETPIPFDVPPKSDSPYPSKIDVWHDEFGIRSIQVVFPGHTFRCGDTGGSGVLQRASHIFAGADKLLSLDAWSGTAARGSLAGLRLTMTSGVANFGIAATTTAAPDLTEDAGGAAICGLFGSTVKSGTRTYVASLGFYVRGGNVSQAVLDHLNDNRRHYSQAVWANADELTLSRILANYSYTPAGSNAAPVILGTLLDPKPIAATGNYLGFRWNFGSEQEREAWTKDRQPGDATFGAPVTNTIAIATKGVFAEAVLGRANSAEKIDLTRFWNWKDSPLQITPADIAPVSTASRAQNLDATAAGMGASQAKFTPLAAMPDPVALQAAQAIATANLFRDMSGLNTMSQVLTKGIEAAAGNDKAAGERAQEALKTATEHLQKMAQIAVDAAGKAAPLATGGGANLSALGGMLNQGGKADSDTKS